MRAAGAWFVAICIGCGTVPNVVFESADGSFAPSPDGGTPSTSEGGPPSALDASATAEAEGGALGCPNQPPNGTECCGDYACRGECPQKGSSGNECRKDCSECRRSQVCCRKGGRVTCIAPAESCP